jgi:hypothetical protein
MVKEMKGLPKSMVEAYIAGAKSKKKARLEKRAREKAMKGK